MLFILLNFTFGGYKLSEADIPKVGDKLFATEVSLMEGLKWSYPDQYVSKKKGLGYLIFGDTKLEVDLVNDQNTYTLKWINPLNGEVIATKEKILGGRISTLKGPVSGGPVIAWLQRVK